MHLHEYSVVDGVVCRPRWLRKRGGALVFSREHGEPIAKAVGGVLVKE